MKKTIPNIAVFASGSGSNAVNIIQHFKTNNIEVNFLVFSNKANAPVLEKTKLLGADTHIFDRKTFYQSERILSILKEKEVQLIVLAGFLWLVPDSIVRSFPNKIINIHPALLPNYGGKGMFGMHVHEAVAKNKEKETGITIHFVDEEYDNGKIILQEKCTIDSADTPSIIAKKVQKLEHKHFPLVVQELFEDIQSKLQ